MDKVNQGFWDGQVSSLKFSLADVPEPHKRNKIITEGSFRKHLVRKKPKENAELC